MSASRKLYEDVAGRIQRQVNQLVNDENSTDMEALNLLYMIGDFGNAFLTDNATFDRGKWRVACGYQMLLDFHNQREVAK